MAQGGNILDRGILPFDQAQQEALLGYLIVDELFLLQVSTRLKPSWFESAMLGKIYIKLLAFLERVGRSPVTPEEFKSEFITEELRESNRLKSLIDRCVLYRVNFGLDLIKMDLNAWCIAMGVRDMLAEAHQIYRNRDIEKARTVIETRLCEINKNLFNKDYRESFDDFENLFREDEINRRRACTTGLKELDDAIDPSNRLGSLLPGETTIYLAPVTTGKTTALITTVRHNVILKGKKVLWITHEDSAANLKKKLLMCMLQEPESRIMAMYKDQNARKRIEQAVEILKRHVVYVAFNKAGGMYIEDLLTIIKAEQQEMKAKNGGKGFDLIVDDYPARLSTKRSHNDPYRTRLGKIYDEFTQIAIEEDLHCVLALQGNRDSSKANRKGTRFVGNEDASESFDVIMFANNIITINRSEEDRINNRTTYFVDKTRHGAGKIAVSCASRYDYFMSFSDELGSHIVASGKPEMSSNGGGVSTAGTEFIAGKSSYAQEEKSDEKPEEKPDSAIIESMKPHHNDTIKEIRTKRHMQKATDYGRHKSLETKENTEVEAD